MKLYHASDDDTLTLHIGICFAEESDLVEAYGENMFTADLNLAAVTVEEIDGHDGYGNWVGDDDYEYEGDADVIEYEDMDPNGVSHWTLRIVSAAGLNALTI